MCETECLLFVCPCLSTTDIGQALKKQMIAERERRGDFIRAEGKKSAMTLTSEGTKMVKFNMGIAEQEATRKRCVGWLCYTLFFFFFGRPVLFG
mgnify:CR=1 FL=1